MSRADSGHSYVVDLFKITSKDTMKPVWRGYCGQRATNLEDLRSWVGDGRIVRSQ